MDDIPNNIDLAGRPELRRFLTAYLPRFRRWWDECGPLQHRDLPMYLRCPVGCDRRGWAEFRFVRPEDYRWGIFQTPATDRRIRFGAEFGIPVWTSVPSDHRNWLLQHIRVQADAEPGSVEQSRGLVASAPSLYDLRNIYQFLLEEARHLWSMVHLLLEHFGADGQAEAEQLLERQCGSVGEPRLLDAFNLKAEDWLSYFIWCFLADRDGKYQLNAVRHAAFDPLARSAAYILFEEPLHLSIGTHGLERVVIRTLELMREHDTDDVFPHGGIPLDTLQRYLNFWAPRVFDLFGNDESRRAREAFVLGLRARAHEPNCADRDATGSRLIVDRRAGDSIQSAEVIELDALNASMRRQFIQEADLPLQRWNGLIAAAGVDYRLRLPSERFARRIGPCAGLSFTPEGTPGDPAGIDSHLPTLQERRDVAELMNPMLAAEQYASWISPPRLGIGGNAPAGFSYVKI
ncbi:MAG: hypothetical protein WED00_03785 [Aquisalimonadaceae bacterium]